MKKILEYGEFSREVDLSKRIKKLVKSPAGKRITRKSSIEGKYFSKEDIEHLISLGAMNVFSGLFPLGEEDDVKLINAILSIKSILYNEFPYCFFDFYSEISPAAKHQNTCKTRRIKWESVKQ